MRYDLDMLVVWEYASGVVLTAIVTGGEEGWRGGGCSSRCHNCVAVMRYDLN
jgi:hypothetical protein